MEQDNLFAIGNYEVFKNYQPKDIGDGRYNNYFIYNSVTEVTEVYVSTYVQAVAAAIELSDGEDQLTDEIANRLESDKYEVKEESTH